MRGDGTIDDDTQPDSRDGFHRDALQDLDVGMPASDEYEVVKLSLACPFSAFQCLASKPTSRVNAARDSPRLELVAETINFCGEDLSDLVSF